MACARFIQGCDSPCPLRPNCKRLSKHGHSPTFSPPPLPHCNSPNLPVNIGPLPPSFHAEHQIKNCLTTLHTSAAFGVPCQSRLSHHPQVLAHDNQCTITGPALGIPTLLPLPSNRFPVGSEHQIENCSMARHTSSADGLGLVGHSPTPALPGAEGAGIQTAPRHRIGIPVLPLNAPTVQCGCRAAPRCSDAGHASDAAPWPTGSPPPLSTHECER
jgi:hypothetical protein